MGWLSNLLLPGRLRTGPTALLPERPDPKTLLAIAQLADPDARLDGDDVIAGGSRILAPVELAGEILGKLGVTDTEKLWACRVAAEGPLPIDYFDKGLAEGIAYRLGGWSLTQGEPTDLADSDKRGALVYLPAAPDAEEVVALLGETVRPVESLDSDRWPDGELVHGIVHIPVNRGVVTDAYAGADVMVTIEEGNRIPPAAQVHWPYLTEIVVARVSVLEPAPASEADTEDDAPGNETADGAADSGPAGSETAGAADADHDIDHDAGTGEGAEPPAADPAEDAAADDEPGEAAEEFDEEALLARVSLALALANRLQGIATDQGGFQLAEPEDILPARYV
ncbi:hypothetical protein Pth03_65340 [Planotetraspora thailandica]|uniref:Uncharacterized protein n=1 Tax=Planotetraspora thailandica TaxID=487172 RepID=A0A8J3XZQ5_9ACTN|nr:hypothetical protein [Planotetraspora thailandica]GII58145.1 hypothetical protein Pth03_65340 [Planotetraspora thailandica]